MLSRFFFLICQVRSEERPTTMKISKSKIFRVFSGHACEVSVRPLHHTRKNPGKFRHDDVTDTPANLAELPFLALLPTPTSPSRPRAFAGRPRAFAGRTRAFDFAPRLGVFAPQLWPAFKAVLSFFATTSSAAHMRPRCCRQLQTGACRARRKRALGARREGGQLPGQRTIA